MHELKRALAALGLRVGGRKPELRMRLHTHNQQSRANDSSSSSGGSSNGGGAVAGDGEMATVDDMDMDTAVSTTIDNPPNTQHVMLEPLVQAIVEACAKQRGRSNRNIPSYVNVRTMVDVIKALGADATCSIVAWHSQGELKAQREGLLECI
eukprot:COSAG01_NODE_1147_length_11515_cov_38.979694_14_plen_151_part_01